MYNLRNQNELAYFKLFVDEELLSIMVEETNIYAEQMIIDGICNETIGTGSRLNTWFPTSVVEMQRFLGVLLWMCLDAKPKLGDYWRKSSLYWSEAASVMSRNRFENLLRVWHFSNNELCPHWDRLYKIQSVVNLLNKKFKKVISHGDRVYIDKTIIPFHRRLKFRQYMNGKSHKFDIKLFKLCLPGGYTYHTKIYCGEDKTDSMSVIFETMSEYLDKGITLYTTNYFTSIELAQKLKERKTHLVGTLRENRNGIPQTILSTELQKGDIIGKERNGIVIFKWKDKRDVLVLSTKHTDEIVDVPGMDGARRKPKAVVEYNKAKTCIDPSDQVSSYSNSVRKSFKWFKKVAVELILGSSIVNAHHLYNHIENQHRSINAFREKLCLQLLSTGKVKEEIPRPVNKHVYCSSGAKGRCTNCYKKNKDQSGRLHAMKITKQTTSGCPGCEKPFLCLNCFFETHRIIPNN